MPSAAAASWHPVTPQIADPDLAPPPGAGPGGELLAPPPASSSFFADHRLAIVVAVVVVVIVVVVMYVYLTRRATAEGTKSGAAQAPPPPPPAGAIPGADRDELIRLRELRRRQRAPPPPPMAELAKTPNPSSTNLAANQPGAPRTDQSLTDSVYAYAAAPPRPAAPAPSPLRAVQPSPNAPEARPRQDAAPPNQPMANLSSTNPPAVIPYGVRFAPPAAAPTANSWPSAPRTDSASSTDQPEYQDARGGGGFVDQFGVEDQPTHLEPANNGSAFLQAEDAPPAAGPPQQPFMANLSSTNSPMANVAPTRPPAEDDLDDILDSLS